MIVVLLGMALALGPAVMEAPGPNSGSDERPIELSDDAEQAKAVRPEEAVITVAGVCNHQAAATGDSSSCKTIVTREEFERLISALASAGQQVPAEGRQQLAQTYVDLLAYEAALRPSGLEDSPEFKALMELVRLRTLSEIHRRTLQAKYSAPSQQDVDDYYRRNPGEFTELQLHRIMIPRRNSSAAGQEEYEKLALQVAHDLRQRAVKGEDFDQLQKEGYKRLNLGFPPATDLGKRRKANLLPEYSEEIASLPAGAVSELKQEKFSFVIYRMDEKHLLPAESVKDEVSRQLARQRLEKALKDITMSVHSEFNTRYFTAAPALQSAR